MDKKTALEILYNERNRLNQKYNTRGWNLWVVIGSISTLIWTFLCLTETNKFVLKEILIIFLICLGVYYSILITYLLFAPKNKSNDLLNNRYYFINKAFSPLRFNLLFHIGLFICFLILNKNLVYLDGYYCIVFNILIRTFITFLFIFLVLSFTKSFTPKNSYNLIVSIFIFILISLVLSGIVFVTYGLFKNIDFESLTKISSIKYALILFGLYYLVLLLYKILTPNKILEKVDVLIDSVLFEKKTIDETFKELEVLILGLELRAFFESSLINYFNALDKFETQCDIVIEKIDDFNSNFEKEILNEKGKKALIDKLDLIGLHIDRLGLRCKDVENYSNQVIKKIIKMQFFKSATADVNNIKEIVNERFSSTKEKFIVVNNKSSLMKNRFYNYLDENKIINETN